MKKKYWYLIFIGLISLGVFWGYIKRDRLEENYLIASGHILNVESFPQGGGIFVAYYFIVDGKKVYNKSAIPHSDRSSISAINELLKNKNFPVIYENGNQHNSRMLFEVKEAEKYNVRLDDKIKYIMFNIDSLGHN